MTNLAIRESELDVDRAEDLRLEALDRFDVLDTPREDGFDGIVRLIKNIFDVPVAIVSVTDAHRQWYKACEGLTNTQAARADSFCDVTIRQSRPLVIGDALADSRFAKNRYVVGEPQIRFYAGVPLRTRDGHNIGTICAMDFKPREFVRKQIEILTDLARVAMAEFEMRQLVTVDALTNVLSRRAVKDEGARAMALARRHELDMSCFAFNLDDFKQVNDLRGSAAGDLVLAGIAGRCRELLRRTDHIGRLSGDEFVVLLPHTDRKGARDAAEKLRAAIEAMTFDVEGARITTQASFGVATMDTDTDDIDALLARSDAALYEAKETGRNRCVSWRRTDGAERGTRRRVLKAGRIHVNGAMSTLDCTVRFLADDGASLDLSTTSGVPDLFDLIMPADAAEMSCHVLARSDRHLEVEFL